MHRYQKGAQLTGLPASLVWQLHPALVTAAPQLPARCSSPLAYAPGLRPLETVAQPASEPRSP